MKKSDLKQLIKPLVKECIHEVLLEEGLLSNVVSEVTKGLQQNMIAEAPSKQPERLFRESMQINKKADKDMAKIQSHRKKLLDAIGSEAYNGVNLFEGTDPLSSVGNPDGNSSMPTPLGDSPSDAGVDISSLIGNASQVWKAIK